jgi:uncharacterized protein YcsI (UPF0317 family)
VCAVNMAMYFTRIEVPLYVYMTGEATISGTPVCYASMAQARQVFSRHPSVCVL